MEAEGVEGHLELFGDGNLESDLRHLFSPSNSPHLSYSIPESYSNINSQPYPPLDLKQEDLGSAAAGRKALGPSAHASIPFSNGSALDKQQQVISEKELRDHFGMPLNEVATKFGICITALKKLCRRYGVRKWPHRRLVAIEKRMATLRDDLRGASGQAQGSMTAELEHLRKEREAIYEGKFNQMQDDDGDANNEHLDLEGSSMQLDGHPGGAMKQEPGPASRRGAEGLSGRGAEELKPHMPKKSSGNKGRRVEGSKEPQGAMSAEGSGPHHPGSDVHPPWMDSDMMQESSAPPGAYLPPEDGVGLVPSDLMGSSASRPVMGGGKESQVSPEILQQIDRLEEENSSLRAISKYLMQERKELLKKAEIAAKRNQNMQCLSRVLRLKLGVLEETQPAGLDAGAMHSPSAHETLALLDEVDTMQDGGGSSSLHFNADQMFNDGPGPSTQEHHASRPNPHPSNDLCWFEGGGDGDLLSDLI